MTIDQSIKSYLDDESKIKLLYKNLDSLMQPEHLKLLVDAGIVKQTDNVEMLLIYLANNGGIYQLKTVYAPLNKLEEPVFKQMIIVVKTLIEKLFKKHEISFAAKMLALYEGENPIKALSDNQRLIRIVDMIDEMGAIDGAHHKQWILDQILIVALGTDGYKDFMKYYKHGGTEDDPIEWDKGIAP